MGRRCGPVTTTDRVIARLYEAERPIIAARQTDKIREFGSATVPGATEHLDYLVDHYVAPEGEMSKIRAAFGG